MYMCRVQYNKCYHTISQIKLYVYDSVGLKMRVCPIDKYLYTSTYT